MTQSLRSYDDSTLQGLSKARKLDDHWSVLRRELDLASAALSHVVGLPVQLKLEVSGDLSLLSSPMVSGLGDVATISVVHVVRLSCPDLKYESMPLARVGSSLEGLPFVLSPSLPSCDRDVLVLKAEDLSVRLVSFLRQLLGSVVTGVVVQGLVDRAKQESSTGS